MYSIDAVCTYRMFEYKYIQYNIPYIATASASSTLGGARHRNAHIHIIPYIKRMHIRPIFYTHTHAYRILPPPRPAVHWAKQVIGMRTYTYTVYQTHTHDNKNNTHNTVYHTHTHMPIFYTHTHIPYIATAWARSILGGASHRNAHPGIGSVPLKVYRIARYQALNSQKSVP